MDYAILAPSLLLLNDAPYRKVWIILATQPKEDEKAAVSHLTTVRGRQHGRLWYWLEPIFCFFLTPWV